MPNVTDEKFIRLKNVMARTGLTRSMVYALVKEGLFPSPINLSPRTVGWLESEINTWIAARIEESRPQAGVCKSPRVGSRPNGRGASKGKDGAPPACNRLQRPRWVMLSGEQVAP